MTAKSDNGNVQRPTVTARLVVAWLFHKDPYISDSQINKELAKLHLPHDRLTRKDGSHYRLLWKAKRLPPAPDEDPRTW